MVGTARWEDMVLVVECKGVGGLGTTNLWGPSGTRVGVVTALVSSPMIVFISVVVVKAIKRPEGVILPVRPIKDLAGCIRAMDTRTVGLTKAALVMLDTNKEEVVVEVIKTVAVGFEGVAGVAVDGDDGSRFHCSKCYGGR